MTYQESIARIRPEFEHALEAFKKELAKIRTGQAHPSLVEDIEADVFGQNMPIKQLGGISCPERRQILIQPWDASYIPAIEKALQKAELGAFPVVEGKSVRLSLPVMTQEYRETLIRLLSEKSEQTKQSMRRHREDAWNEIQDAAKVGEIREDDKFKGKEELQKLVDNYGSMVEEAVERKRVEIQE